MGRTPEANGNAHRVPTELRIDISMLMAGALTNSRDKKDLVLAMELIIPNPTH